DTVRSPTLRTDPRTVTVGPSVCGAADPPASAPVPFCPALSARTTFGVTESIFSDRNSGLLRSPAGASGPPFPGLTPVVGATTEVRSSPGAVVAVPDGVG